MSFEEFLMLLTEWGKWSRGGIPKYRCFLNREYHGKPLINDDVAQELDSILCTARKRLKPDNTESFERMVAVSYSSIPPHGSQSSRF